MSWTIKIDRARQHMIELKGEINSFFVSHPYSIRTKRNPQTGQLIYFLTKAKSVPENVALISGDIIQNLRSALDYLVYKLFVLETGVKTSGRHIYFPIEKDAKTYEKEKHRKTTGISQKSIKLIDTIKPYKGGNDTLWCIHELNNIDKHRLLITVGSSFGSMDIGAHISDTIKKSFPDQNIPSIPLFIKPADILFPLKVGDELFIDTPDAKEIPNMQFRFNIVLNESGIVNGKPLTDLLQSMIDEVEKLVPIFK